MQVSGELGSGNRNWVCGFWLSSSRNCKGATNWQESGFGNQVPGNRFLEPGSGNQVLGQVLCELGLARFREGLREPSFGIENRVSGPRCLVFRGTKV